MAILLKCAPAELHENGNLIIEEKIYKGAKPRIGDTVFIWFFKSKASGSSQPHGAIKSGSLQARGTIESVEFFQNPNNRKCARLDIRLTDRSPIKHLTFNDLEPHWKDSRDPLRHRLASYIFGHAHGKIASLDAELEDFLDKSFDADATSKTSKPPILLLHIVNMSAYNGDERAIHAGGFKHAAKAGWGHEMYNFAAFKGRCYGHVEIMPRDYGAGPQPISLDIEKLGAAKGAAFAKGVLVVWIAPCRNGEGREIVGWYRNARVYRDRQEPKGELKKARTFRVPKTKVKEVCTYRAEAAASDCRLLTPDERVLRIAPRKRGSGKGLGRTLLYLSQKEDDESRQLEKKLRDFIDSGVIVTTPSSAPSTGQAGGGYQADVERRKKIEIAAIEHVTRHFADNLKYHVESREPDNKGYDLYARNGDIELCIEVKGRSGPEVVADFSFNEYEKICLHQKGRFTDGDYRICIVTDALGEIDAPNLHHFRWWPEQKIWLNSDNGAELKLEPRQAARATVAKKKKRHKN